MAHLFIFCMYNYGLQVGIIVVVLYKSEYSYLTWINNIIVGDEMKFEHISVMAAVMWEILALAVGVLAFWLILLVFVPHTWIWYLLLWILGALMIGITFIYIPFLYLNTEFAIDDQVVVYKKGVLFTSTQILYLDRIVFVTVYNNPLTPILKVSSLVISAAGGSMTILFLNSKRAKELANIFSCDKAGF